MMLLTDHLERYLALRRGLGYRLVGHETVLSSFCSYMEEVGETTLTVRVAQAFIERAGDADASPFVVDGARLCHVSLELRPVHRSPAEVAGTGVEPTCATLSIHRRSDGRADRGGEAPAPGPLRRDDGEPHRAPFGDRPSPRRGLPTRSRGRGPRGRRAHGAQLEVRTRAACSHCTRPP